MDRSPGFRSSRKRNEARQFFGRQEAPLVGIPGLESDEVLFCMAGTIPNRRSAPVVDEWFGLRFKGSRFEGRMTMDELIGRTRFDREDQPNAGTLMAEDAKEIALLPEVVQQAKQVMAEAAKAYEEGPYQQIYTELDILDRLKERHKAHLEEKYEQLTYVNRHKQKDAEQRHIDQIFEEFYDWVRESLEIEARHPYIRIVAAFYGCESIT